MKKLLMAMLIVAVSSTTVLASSHREAPEITKRPQIDGTDFYMFRSYEPGRDNYITLIANYNPLQDPYGGPNYFPLDEEAVYDIHISNDGDAKEDITFRFRFDQEFKNIGLDVGDGSGAINVPIPLMNAGIIGPDNESALNVVRQYQVQYIEGDSTRGIHYEVRRSSQLLKNAFDHDTVFKMPFDNIGNKSIPDYETYANSFIHDVEIPECGMPGRVFVGQRKESFAVNLGEIFDLVNVSNPLGATDAEESDTADKNITTIALEVPIACLTQDSGEVIAGWTTASKQKIRTFRTLPRDLGLDHELGPLVQVSRLGNPLVNEVVIGLPDKDKFNASHPTEDDQFAYYVTHPTLPELLEILFGDAGVQAPNFFPRADLVQIFLTGVSGLNQDGSYAEIMRLNTTIPPVAKSQQNSLGVLGGDNAGYPNGRRPGDDVVDISLRAVMGVLLDPMVAPSSQLPFTDGTAQSAEMFDDTFPYLLAPIPGSPNDTPQAGGQQAQSPVQEEGNQSDAPSAPIVDDVEDDLIEDEQSDDELVEEDSAIEEEDAEDNSADDTSEATEEESEGSEQNSEEDEESEGTSDEDVLLSDDAEESVDEEDVTEESSEDQAEETDSEDVTDESDGMTAPTQEDEPVEGGDDQPDSILVSDDSEELEESEEEINPVQGEEDASNDDDGSFDSGAADQPDLELDDEEVTEESNEEGLIDEQSDEEQAESGEESSDDENQAGSDDESIELESESEEDLSEGEELEPTDEVLDSGNTEPVQPSSGSVLVSDDNSESEEEQMESDEPLDTGSPEGEDDVSVPGSILVPDAPFDE